MNEKDIELALQDPGARREALIRVSDALLVEVFGQPSNADVFGNQKGSDFAGMESDPMSLAEMANVVDVLGRPLDKPTHDC